MLDLETILRAITEATKLTSTVRGMVETARSTFGEKDQAKLDAALEALQKENDALFLDTDEALRVAAGTDSNSEG